MICQYTYLDSTQFDCEFSTWERWLIFISKKYYFLHLRTGRANICQRHDFRLSILCSSSYVRCAIRFLHFNRLNMKMKPPTFMIIPTKTWKNWISIDKYFMNELRIAEKCLLAHVWEIGVKVVSSLHTSGIVLVYTSSTKLVSDKCQENGQHENTCRVKIACMKLVRMEWK